MKRGLRGAALVAGVLLVTVGRAEAPAIGPTGDTTTARGVPPLGNVPPEILAVARGMRDRPGRVRLIRLEGER